MVNIRTEDRLFKQRNSNQPVEQSRSLPLAILATKLGRIIRIGDPLSMRNCRMSNWKWIVAGRRAVMAVRRLLRRNAGSWRPAVAKNCRRQIPLPAPCKRRKIPLLDNLQICRDKFANYLTKRVLSPIDRTNFGVLWDGFGGFSLSSGRLVPSAGLTPRNISPGGGGRRWPRLIARGRAGLPRRG